MNARNNRAPVDTACVYIYIYSYCYTNNYFHAGIELASENDSPVDSMHLVPSNDVRYVVS